MTDYKRLSQHLKLMAHPERLRILDILRRSSECVCHLEVLLRRPQPYISQQLRILSRAGVITDEKEGVNVFYRVSDREMLNWLNLILGPAPVESLGQHEAVAECVCPKCQRELIRMFA